MGLNAREINFFSRNRSRSVYVCTKIHASSRMNFDNAEGDEKSEKEKNENRAQYDLIIFSRYVAIMSGSRLAKY